MFARKSTQCSTCPYMLPEGYDRCPLCPHPEKTYDDIVDEVSGAFKRDIERILRSEQDALRSAPQTSTSTGEVEQ